MAFNRGFERRCPEGTKDQCMKESDLFGRASLVIHSSDIFARGKLVLIEHNREWYRLMITKQGKLILTK